MLITSISQTQRYLPHELNTKYYSVRLYRNGYSVSFVCRRYKISKSSLMKWNRKFNGTKESLIDKPKIIQTDNGFEFTHHSNTKRIHPFDTL